MTACERCRKEPEGEYGLHDYCGACSKNLCPKCMAAGCCGRIPALSGMGEDEQPPEQHDDISDASRG